MNLRNTQHTVIAMDILNKVFIGLAILCLVAGTVNIGFILHSAFAGIENYIVPQWPVAYTISAVAFFLYKSLKVPVKLKKTIFHLIAVALPLYVEVNGSGLQSAIALTTFFSICTIAISSKKKGWIYALFMFAITGLAHFTVVSSTLDDSSIFHYSSSALIGCAIMYIVSFYIQQLENSSWVLQESLEVGGLGIVRKKFRSNKVSVSTTARKMLNLDPNQVYFEKGAVYDLIEEPIVRTQIYDIDQTNHPINKYRLRMSSKDIELSSFNTKSHNYWILRDVSKDAKRAAVLEEKNNELELQKKELEYLINHDHLTKVMSRRGINAMVREHYSTKYKTYSILLVDLDYFKHVNDTYGHQAGDFVLRQIARIISDAVGPDGHVGRMGGEEFMVVTAFNLLNASILAEKIKDAVSSYRFKISNDNDHTIRSTCSIGVASYNKEYPEDIIKFSDTALSYAKDTGRNRVVTANRNFMDQLERRGELITLQDIEEAIIEGAIQYYVQPIINTKYNEVLGFEALLRWEGTFLSPETWIKKLEIVINNDITMAHRLHMEALNTVTLVKAYFPQAYVSFNMTLESFAHNMAYQNFVKAWTTGEAAGSSISLSDIVVEIVEDAASQRCNVDMAIANMRVLHERGVTFALDDFGKESSNIGRLQTFPVNVLKIDKQFVDDILDSDSKSYKTLVKISELASELGIKVIVEGVETDAHAKVCESLGLYNHQGWLYSKAIPNHQVKHFTIRKKEGRYLRGNVVPFSSPVK